MKSQAIFRMKAIRRITALLTVLGALLLGTAPAQAEVQVSFHSFNGSVLFGRYPHTFVVFEGVLEDTGTVIEENFGFSARSSMAAISSAPSEHMIITETARTIAKTNRHFTITVSDEEYRDLRSEVTAWQDHPGKFYDLDENNCIHFVARLAEMAGLEVDVPERFLRRPKAWLNYITQRNPQLGADVID